MITDKKLIEITAVFNGIAWALEELEEDDIERAKEVLRMTSLRAIELYRLFDECKKKEGDNGDGN